MLILTNFEQLDNPTHYLNQHFQYDHIVTHAKCKTHSAEGIHSAILNSHPDIFIHAWGAPYHGSVVLMEEIREEHPGLPIVVFSVYDEVELHRERLHFSLFNQHLLNVNEPSSWSKAFADAKFLAE